MVWILATGFWNDSGVWDDGDIWRDSGVTVTVSPSSLPNGTVSLSYSQTVTPSGGTAPYRFDVRNGSLPTGLSIDASTGIISGTPTVAGVYTFTVRAFDAHSDLGSQAYSLTIAAVTVSTSPPLTGAPGGGLNKGQSKKRRNTTGQPMPLSTLDKPLFTPEEVLIPPPPAVTAPTIQVKTTQTVVKTVTAAQQTKQKSFWDEVMMFFDGIFH